MTSDEELLERFAARRDAGSFEEIVRRHVGMVYGAARRMVGQTEGQDVAHLDRNQPDYEEKLRRVLENIKAQVGGEWSIEQREIETWEPAVK